MKAISDLSKATALRFVLLIGITSLFADVTYEGARSITGPYLGALGANAAIVGFVAGFGELVGYGLRYISGYLVDKTKRYWTIAITGYVINLLAVPLLALTGFWPMAAGLIIAERVGKAIRVPARDTMLSHAAHKLGSGWVFGLHEALDKTGAMLGPLVIAFVIYKTHHYQTAFASLAIPAFLALIMLFIAFILYPKPQNLEAKVPELETRGINTTFWLYILGSGFVAAGYADFPLIAYHFGKTNVLTLTEIPISYAFAMGTAGLSALLFGKVYDKNGFGILVILTVIASFFAPLVFWGGFSLVYIGVCIWGIGMGANQSLMRAVVANLISADKRGSAYGLFNMGFGIFWFLGSALMGILYDNSINLIVAFSVIAQLVGAVILFAVMKRIKQGSKT